MSKQSYRTDNGPANSSIILKLINTRLNEQGYSFQYSVIQRIIDLEKEGYPFHIEVAEFPAEIQNRGTRVDFILKYRDRPLFCICECKRANPALKNWCFFQAPFVRRARSTEYCFAERSGYRKVGTDSIQGPIYDDFCSEGVRWFPLNEAYHISIEIQSKQKGDSQGSGKSTKAIEEAATQVCRGLNGMVEFFKDNDMSTVGQPATFLPVIFTTAAIYTCSHDLSSGNLKDGNTTIADAELNQTNWVYYQYHVSPGIKHAVIPNKRKDVGLGEVLDLDYVRTIPIVNSLAIKEFLLELSHHAEFTF